MHVDPASNDPAKSSIRIDHDSVDDIICRTDGHVRASFSGRGAYFDTRWSLWRDNPYTQFLEANFQYADTDNNAYLDRKEASSSIYNNIFSELDAGGNGMVFEDEVEQYSKLLNSGTLGVTLTVTEKGQSLFSMLDQDANQVISLVEAAKCRELLARFDSNQDGAIAVDELLPTYQLSADYTAPKGLQVYFPGVRVQSADVRSKVDAPPWFSRLDINGDEAISRFEFPWSLERFASLDANGDGSIFIEESRP